MSFEELSGDDSESEVEVPKCSLLDHFPAWNETIDDEAKTEESRNSEESRSKNSTGNSVAPRKTNARKPKTLQPFKRLLAQKNSERKMGRSDDCSENDGDSQHFSISTDFHQAYWQPKLSSSATFDSCVTPSSAEWEPDLEQTRVTLQKFMESSVQETTSRFHPMNLADIAADDNASVGSHLLTVSYDEQYPQLVLQPSLDGTAGSKIGTGQGAAKLGANYAHPAAAARTNPDDIEGEQLICSTEWIEDNIEKVWEQIDFDLKNQGGFDETSSTSSSTSENDPLAQWIEEAIEWSHSAGDSARSLTDMIEREFVQPIIDFVDSPQVETSRKGNHPRLRLVPYVGNRKAAKHQNSTNE